MVAPSAHAESCSCKDSSTANCIDGDIRQPCGRVEDRDRVGSRTVTETVPAQDRQSSRWRQRYRQRWRQSCGREGEREPERTSRKSVRLCKAHQRRAKRQIVMRGLPCTDSNVQTQLLQQKEDMYDECNDEDLLIQSCEACIWHACGPCTRLKQLRLRLS